MSAKKRKSLSLSDRMRVLERATNGRSARQIAKEIDVGKTQIQGIVKRKEDILRDYSSGASQGQKRRKLSRTGNELINSLTLEWFVKARSKNIPISWPLLQKKALMIASELKNDKFKASNGWLELFRKRNNISFAALSGESDSVNKETVADWETRIEKICEGYSPENIFNLDETGLFFRALPSKS